MRCARLQFSRDPASSFLFASCASRRDADDDCQARGSSRIQDRLSMERSCHPLVRTHSNTHEAAAAQPNPRSALLCVLCVRHASAVPSLSLHPRSCACPAHAHAVIPVAPVQPAAASSSWAASAASAAVPFDLLSHLQSLAAAPSAVAVVDLPAAHLPSLIDDDSFLPALPETIECAVPKKRTSVSRARHRRAGDRIQKRRKIHQNYRICFVCGTPVLQHHICMKCMHLPTRTY